MGARPYHACLPASARLPARPGTRQVLRDKGDVPSNFTLKLRKHLRTRRCEAVVQLGVDRCVDLVFGSGPAAYHLILEMYAQGNVILTDHKYEVLTLLRSHRDDAAGLIIMARHPYPMASVSAGSAGRGACLLWGQDAYAGGHVTGACATLG